MIERIRNKEINPDRIWFSDECHFYVHGYVNKQNHRILGTSYPHEILERPAHPEFLTVWMAISSTGFIGPFFFYDTVNGEAYEQMLRDFLIEKASEQNEINAYWFKQDGALPHRTRAVKELIRSVFSDRIIGIGFETDTGREIAWPPYSPDLNQCDFYLEGAMKDYVFKNKQNGLKGLKKTIEESVHKS